MALTSREALRVRFDALIEKTPGADPFAPTEFGESFMYHLLHLAAGTAYGPAAVRSLAALEDDPEHSLDVLVSRVRDVILDHVEATTAEPPTTAEIAAWKGEPNKLATA
jgi:hypothetical protein